MELSNYIGGKIKYYRELKNLTQDELAEMLGTTRQSVSRYENGERKANQDILFELADIFKISINNFFPSIEQISTIETIYNQLNEPRQTKVYDFAKNQLDEQNKIVHIADYKDIELTSKVSAGRGIVDLEPDYKETIQYDGQLPRSYDMAFQVAGNSMEPVFQDEDIVFVECQPDAVNGALMVVQVDDEAFVKKVYIDGSTLRLVSLNKEYQDIFVDKDANIKIIGKVVF